jgi:hypothetical protein
MVVEAGSLRSLNIVRLRAASDGYQSNRPSFGTHANAPRYFRSVKDGRPMSTSATSGFMRVASQQKTGLKSSISGPFCDS